MEDKEDKTEWIEFFGELGKLLNKYHFMISEFVLGRAIDKRVEVVSFSSDGKRITPSYYIPKDVADALALDPD